MATARVSRVHMPWPHHVPMPVRVVVCKLNAFVLQRRDVLCPLRIEVNVVVTKVVLKNGDDVWLLTCGCVRAGWQAGKQAGET